MDNPTPSTNNEKGISMAAIVLLFLWMLITFIYGIRNRSFSDFIHYGGNIFGALLSIGCIVLIAYIVTNISKGIEWKFIGLLIIALPFAFILGSIEYYSMFVTLKDIFLWIKSPSFSGNGKVICIALLTLALGAGLFYFRLKLRACYGMTEAVVGLIVATNKIPTEAQDITNPEFYLAILTASLYLVVRGFDNIHQGLTKDPKDPLAHKFNLFLRTKIST